MADLSVGGYRLLWTLHKNPEAFFEPNHKDFSELIARNLIDFETGKLLAGGQTIIEILEKHAAPLLHGIPVFERVVKDSLRVFNLPGEWYTFNWHNQSVYLSPRGILMLVGTIPLKRAASRGARFLGTIPPENKKKVIDKVKGIEDPKKWIPIVPVACVLESIGGRQVILLQSPDKALLFGIDAIYYDYLKIKHRNSCWFVTTEIPTTPIIFRSTAAYAPTINTYTALVGQVRPKEGTDWVVLFLEEQRQKKMAIDCQSKGVSLE